MKLLWNQRQQRQSEYAEKSVMKPEHGHAKAASGEDEQRGPF